MNVIYYLIIICLCHKGLCYRLYPALNSMVFTNIKDSPDNAHSEYFFGKCASRFKALMVHDTYTYNQLRNKLIIRGWMNQIRTPPNCVYIRATSLIGDIVKYHAFKFGICICWITYVHDSRVYRYFFYEWYTPVSMMKDITWDLFFYKYPVPPKKEAVASNK